MEQLKLFFNSVLRLYCIDFQIFGYTISFFDLLIATIICGIVGTVVCKIMEL